MKWRLFKRNLKDNRAPSVISMDDYEMLTVVEDLPREEVIRLWVSNPSEFEGLRDDNMSRVGDVLEDADNENYFILTPQGFWAKIEVI